MFCDNFLSGLIDLTGLGIDCCKGCMTDPSVANAVPEVCRGTPDGKFCTAFSCKPGYNQVGGDPKCQEEQWVQRPKCAYCPAYFGHLHFRSVDGNDFHYHKTGTIIAIRSEINGILWQIRTYQPEGIIIPATVVGMIAFQFGNDIMTLVGSIQPPQLRINGEIAVLQEGDELFLGTGPNMVIMSFREGKYSLISKRGASFGVWTGGADMFRIATDFLLSSTFWFNTDGLLGLYNDIPEDDFLGRDGVTYPLEPDEEGQHTAFGDTWLVDEEESLFGVEEDEIATADPRYQFPPSDTLLALHSSSYDDIALFELPASDPAFPFGTSAVECPLVEDATEACKDNPLFSQCMFDVIIGGPDFANDEVYQPPCIDVVCSNHGICVGGVCNCVFGWTGDTCEIRLCPSPCETADNSSGECRTDGFCDCMMGFTGENCEFIADCASLNDCNSVNNGGNCIDDDLCECNDGFDAPDCQPSPVTGTISPTETPTETPTVTPTVTPDVTGTTTEAPTTSPIESPTDGTISSPSEEPVEPPAIGPCCDGSHSRCAGIKRQNICNTKLSCNWICGSTATEAPTSPPSPASGGCCEGTELCSRIRQRGVCDSKIACDWTCSTDTETAVSCCGGADSRCENVEEQSTCNLLTDCRWNCARGSDLISSADVENTGLSGSQVNVDDEDVVHVNSGSQLQPQGSSSDVDITGDGDINGGGDVSGGNAGGGDSDIESAG